MLSSSRGTPLTWTRKGRCSTRANNRGIGDGGLYGWTSVLFKGHCFAFHASLKPATPSLSEPYRSQASEILPSMPPTCPNEAQIRLDEGLYGPYLGWGGTEGGTLKLHE